MAELRAADALGFGISFQLPLVMLFLERIGIFSVESYLAKWRIAVLVLADPVDGAQPGRRPQQHDADVRAAGRSCTLPASGCVNGCRRGERR